VNSARSVSEGGVLAGEGEAKKSEVQLKDVNESFHFCVFSFVL